MERSASELIVRCTVCFLSSDLLSAAKREHLAVYAAAATDPAAPPMPCPRCGQRAARCIFPHDTPEDVLPDTGAALIAALAASGCPERAREAILDANGFNCHAPWVEVAYAHGGEGILVMAGRPGSGKTVAACWLMRMAMLRYRAKRDARWASAFDLSAAGRFDHEDEFASLGACSHLVIDDMGREYLDPKGWLLSVFDALINRRYESCLQTVITTNLTAKDFAARYGERIVDRMREVGTYLELSAPSMRKKP